MFEYDKLTRDLIERMYRETRWQYYMRPSYSESWPIVVCEAMASGLPLIAYDLPALKEIYCGGIIRVHVKDVDEFANAALKLFKDNELYAKLQMEAL